MKKATHSTREWVALASRWRNIPVTSVAPMRFARLILFIRLLVGLVLGLGNRNLGGGAFGRSDDHLLPGLEVGHFAGVAFDGHLGLVVCDDDDFLVLGLDGDL